MVESYTLATELARCCDHVEAFARYQQRLAPLLRSKQDAATGLGLAFAPRNRFQLFTRNSVMKLMALPKPGSAELLLFDLGVGVGLVRGFRSC